MSRRMYILMLAVMLVLSGCGRNRTKESQEISKGETSAQETTSAVKETESFRETASTARETESAQKTTENTKTGYGTEEDYVTEIPADAVYITGQGDHVEISGQGAQANAGAVTITGAGTYVLEGSFNGQVLINGGKDDIVHLVLAGTDIVSEESAAIYQTQKGKVVITLKEQTANRIADGSVYAYAQTGKEEPDAVIFSKGHLTMNGTGSLTVQGNHENGICSEEDLFIVSGTYDITAADEGVEAKNAVTILDGTLSIHSGSDAIHGETDVVIEGGTIDIKDCEEGIEASRITINGGTVSINAKEEAIDPSSSLAVNGGTIVAVGNSDNAIGLSRDSTQCVLLYHLKNSQNSGTQLVLKDQKGNELLSRTIDTSYRSVLISLPEMKANETYVLIGGTETAEITLDHMSYGTGAGGSADGNERNH